MSEGDPYKRQKVSEENHPQSSDENTIIYQNACLSLKLKQQREDISKLQTQISTLSQKLKSKEDFVTALNLKWSKTLADLNSLCAELSICPVKPSPFDIFIQDVQGLEGFSDISKKCVSNLINAIEKVSDFESGAIVENCRVQLDANLIQSENMRLKLELDRTREECSRLGNEVDELKLKNMNLEVRLIKKGDLNTDAISDKVEDFEEIKRQKDAYERMYKEEILKKGRNEYLKNVSFEGFVKSRTFKELIQNAIKIKNKLEDYRQKYNDLYEYRIKFKEKFKKECDYIEEKEGKKREELEKKVRKTIIEMKDLETAKNEAVLALEMLKKIQAEQKSSKNHSTLIDLLTSDKEKLKKKNKELQATIENLQKKLEEYETTQHPSSGDPDVQKLNKIIEDYKRKLKSEQQNSESFIKEIEVTENAYAKIQEKVRYLTNQLEKQEDLYNKLMTEKVKESSWKSVYDQETLAYESKIKNLEELISSQEELHKELEKVIKNKDSLIESLRKKCKELEDKVKDVYEKHEEGILKVNELTEYKKDYRASLKRAEDEHKKTLELKYEAEKKAERLKEEIYKLENENTRLKDPIYLKSTDDVLNREVAYYRKIIKCSVCHQKNKDTILSKCLHVFCKGCLLDHLENRNRKCPLCKNRFNQDDMKNFNWDQA